MVLDGSIGWVGFEVVKDINDGLGDVAFGHAVGNNVMKLPTKTERPLEQVQIRGLLLGIKKYTKILSLRTIHAARKPIPFKSRLVVLPLAILNNINFTASSGKRDINGDLAVEFVATLTEYRKLGGLSAIIRAGAEVAWLAWTLATYPDRATGVKLYPSSPGAEQEPVTAFSEYIESTRIDNLEVEDLDTIIPNITNEQLIACNILNKRFSKLPFDVNGTFPQTVKLQIHQDQYYPNIFNDITDIPDEYIDYARQNKYDNYYAYPIFNSYKIQILEFTIAPKYSGDYKYYTLTVKIDDSIKFEQKIMVNEIYNISDYQITFNSIDISDKNIQPEDQEGKTAGSIIEGGVRPN